MDAEKIKAILVKDFSYLEMIELRDVLGQAILELRKRLEKRSTERASDVLKKIR